MRGSSARGIVFIDADDTLWENNLHFEAVISEYTDWVAAHGVSAVAARDALEAEEDVTIRTLGYGARPFCRSVRAAFTRLLPNADAVLREEMDAFAARAISQIRDHAILLLPGVLAGVAELAATRHLVVLTKGQPDEQAAKTERSGLLPHFAEVLVVPEKTVATYTRATANRGVDPALCWMVGNSPNSDVNPARAAGLRTIYVPHPAPWHRDRGRVDGTDGIPTQIAETFADVPEFIRSAG